MAFKPRVTPSVSRGPTACRVCRHADRARIELMAVSGVSHVTIAKKFGISRFSCDRHLLRHLSEVRRAQLVAGPLRLHELAERAADESMSILDYLSMLRSTLLHQFLACSEAGDSQSMSTLSGRLLECLRLLAQLSGDLTQATSTITNNTLILGSPIMNDLQAMLIRVLRPYPEAARAVMEGLEQLSERALNGVAPHVLPALEAPAQ
jgi:hypothetical protein